MGFAAETGDEHGSVLDLGRAKLERKGCDLLVVNAVGAGRAFEMEDNEGWLLGADGTVGAPADGLEGGALGARCGTRSRHAAAEPPNGLSAIGHSHGCRDEHNQLCDRLGILPGQRRSRFRRMPLVWTGPIVEAGRDCAR